MSERGGGESAVAEPATPPVVARAYEEARRAVADESRLAAVRATGLLDSEVEEVFDRLTRLAVRLVRVPAAFISLVDEHRDFYKSACGFGEPLASSRELGGPTFCHYAVQSARPLVIPDTAADPVYREVPTVRSLGVAAYVGVPLVVGGQAIGSFCAIDVRPRAWTADDLEVLTELAASAQREVELRGAVRDAERTAEQLHEQAVELEVAHEQLQEQAAELETLNDDLLATNEHLSASHDQLATERARLEMLLAEAPVVIARYVGAEHRVVYVNPMWERSVGRPDALGRPARELFPELADSGLFEIMDRVCATGTPYVNPELHVRFDRWNTGALEDSYWHVVWQPLLLEGAEAHELLLYAVDVTPQVQARRELERARRAAEEANRAKAEFLANMSHELRTPLNAIGGHAELMQLGVHGPVSAEQRDSLERIRRSQKHLLGLISAILDFARVEAGRVAYRMEEVSLAETTQEVGALVEALVVAKQLRLAQPPAEGVPGDPEVRVHADREKLVQILLNLLSNSVKFTDADGRITVEWEAEGEQVWLRVRDTGRGIPPDKLQTIFEPFAQVDVGRTRTTEGAGLGLAISRDLARGMGGDLTVHSEPEVGSVFTLTLKRV